jgi:GT2 family glycosyltransferase
VTTPHVTIVIPTYNGICLLCPCLEALRRQTFRDFSILVVDDGSTDATIAILRRDFPEVAVLALDTNSGLARAQNAGIAASSGEFVVVLNNDTEAEPQWLERLVAVAHAHPDAWAVAGKLRLWDRRTILHAAGDGFGTDGVPVNLGVWDEDRGQWYDGRWVWGPQGGAALFRRSALEFLSGDEIGMPYDESLFMYCEDVDLNWRARLSGYETAFAPDAIVYHHLSATGGGTLASYYVGRNTLAVLMKDVPGTILRRHAWAIVRAQFRVAVDSMQHIREPAARARVRGQFAVIPLLPHLIGARRRVLAARRVSDAWLASRLYAPPQ